MKITSAGGLLAAALLGLGTSLADAATPLAGYTDSVYTTLPDVPTSLAFAPDGSGRLFVTLKNGQVRVISRETQAHTVFTRFSPYTASECGVLGVTFFPDFDHHPLVYVFVTVSGSEQRIFRLTDAGSHGTGKIPLIKGLPTVGANHDGGSIGVGADGRLYWGVGDNGIKRGVDGDLTLLNAKVGRARLNGTAPSDNPFVDGSGPQNDFIWATGFRNPFKMRFQPRTGLLWLDVVGSTPEGQTEPNSGPGFEQIFILHAGEDGGYDDYEGNQPDSPRFTNPAGRAGLVKPLLQYRTDWTSGSSGMRNVTSLARSAGVLTITTSAPVAFHVGEIVTVNDAVDSTSRQYVVATIGSSSFTARDEGADFASNNHNGTATPLAGNGCVVGGAFYESTAFPDSAGAYFFGDYNSGTIWRVKLDDQNHPGPIVRFVTGIGHPTDVALGVDGALYYTNTDENSIHRVAWSSPDRLLVTPTTLPVLESFDGVFTVRLPAKPAADVQVTIAKQSGDDDLTADKATLTFTPANWKTPQKVTVRSAVDDDSTDDEATFAVTATGYPDENVHVLGRDLHNDLPIVSTDTLTIQEKQTGTFTVALPRQPGQDVTLSVRRSSGSQKVKVTNGASLVFTPANWSTPQTVTVKALADHNDVANKTRLRIAGTSFWSRFVDVSLTEP